LTATWKLKLTEAVAVQIIGAFETHVGRGWLPSDLNSVASIIEMRLGAVHNVVAT